MPFNPRIIIIGSGAAGYAAACKLLEFGFSNISILEAENRIGGRINSVEFGSGMVDLGAQWCHGEQNNIVFEMVKGLNLLQNSTSDFENYCFVDSQGRFMNTATVNKLKDLLFLISDDINKMQSYEGSLGEYVITNYEELIKLYQINVDRKVSKQVLEFFHKLMNNLNATSTWFEISTKGHVSYEECEGNHTLCWKNKGFKRLFSVLKKEIPDARKKLPIDEKILLNKEVVKIMWNNNQHRKKTVVECSDGSVYKADHVISTVSLGVLKEKSNELFIPELPTFKKNAIKGLSFGCVNKIFLKFPKKWWPDDCIGFSFLWNEDDLKNVLKEFPQGPQKNGVSWISSIFGFYLVDYNPNLLFLFINDDFGREIEILSDDLIKQGCTYVLKKFLGKHYNISEPESILRSKWYTNKHFRGSYSYISFESEKLNATNAALAEPLGNNSLLFAGEATHSLYYSTVHGAVESGFREAYRILSHYNNFKCPKILKCNVAIVGAGIAGLGAAVTLLQAGCENILLLEAQSKPGGRIRSMEIADGYIDLGAQWLHGDGNNLWQISQDNELISRDTVYEGRGLFLREDGYKFNDFLVEKVGFIIGKILDDCEEFIDSVDFPESVGQYLEDKFKGYLKNSSLTQEEIRLYLELYDWNVRFQIIDNCCDNLYNVSAKFWGRYFCPTSNGQAHINFTKGHGSLIDILVNTLPKNTLLTNHAVTNINWSMKDETVKLTCQNSTIVEADAVIVTSSLGVLKKFVSKMFTPNLPLKMTKIIDAMGFASIGKIFLLFDEKWWANEEGFQLVWNFNQPYGNDWWRYLSGFDPVLDQPNMLLGWIGGLGAQLVESVPEDEIGRKCAELLRKFTGNTNISNPIKVVRSRWTKNPWILGGYSHTTPKCDDQDLLPEILQQPLRDAKDTIRVLLAGEHTHPMHFSTTHGAYETGMRQAQLLIDENVACTF